MELVRLVWGIGNLIFNVPNFIQAEFKRQKIGIQEICDRYDVEKPETMIMYAKYYASSHTDGGPDLEYLINSDPKDPSLFLSKTIERITKESDKIIYLKWLIERIPKTPTFLYLNDLMDSKYFTRFYNLAGDLLESYKGKKKENKDEKLIIRFAEIYSYKSDTYTRKFIEKYIRCYHNTRGIPKSRRSATKKMLFDKLDNKSEKSQFDKINDGTFSNWEEQWEEFYKVNNEPRTVNP